MGLESVIQVSCLEETGDPLLSTYWDLSRKRVQQGFSQSIVSQNHQREQGKGS